MLRPLAPVTATLAALLLCAGCAAAPSAAPAEPTTPATPSAAPADPTPTPTPEAVAERIVVTAESMAVLMSDGFTGATFDYFEPADLAVEGLTDVLGAAPTTTQEPGNPDDGSFTLHEWDGVAIWDLDRPASAPFRSDWTMLLTAPTAGGVALETVDGVQVGDSASALEAAYPDQFTHVECCGQPERTDFRIGAKPIEATEQQLAEIRGELPEETSPEFAVWVLAADSAGAVTRILAPSPNFGA